MVMPSSLELDPRGDPLIGQTLGSKYTLDRLIGRGGMGHVYSATTTAADGELSHRDVVIKVIAPPLAQQPQAMARFEREAKRLDGLRHSNIVEMYDYGRDGGRAYIVMEWVDGELLSDYLARKGALSLADFVPIAAQILKGVGHAHSRDLMIRDIKPTNVMLCERKGRANFVKIIDFGLAKMLEGDEDITKQHFIGTSGYLSPEQIKGLDIDLRVDVYALGVLFYQMLSGRMPFEAENDTTLLYKHVHEFPIPLSEVLPAGHEVPDELVHLIHDCLEKDREDRPHDANEIVEKLIDCVPMSMFKLPPVSAATTEDSAVSALSTTALAAPTGESASFLQREAPGVDSASASVSGRPVTGAGVSPSAEHSQQHGLVSVEPIEPAQGSKLGLIAVAIAVVAALGAGGVLLFGRVVSPPAPMADAPTPAPEPEPEPAGTDLGVVVAKAEQELGKGEFEAAEIELAAIRSEFADALADDRGLADRVERLDAGIQAGKLLASAKQLDDQGMTRAAIEAYQAVLEADAAHVEAQERIAALEATIGPGKGTIEIVSNPIAEISIGGSPAGNTPFGKPLPIGKHTVSIRADGYVTWYRQVVIKAGDNPAIEVELLPVKKPATGTGTGASTGTSTGTKPKPSTTTSSPPDSTPTPTPAKPAEPDNPFLPTKKKTDNGPFLPTEK
jgi:eukaryotic-like serine/threonine-protein kinase